MREIFSNRRANVFAAGIILAAAACCLGASSDPLRAYFGPQPGKTYVYTIDSPGHEPAPPATVASIEGQDTNSLITCSPASASEYPEDMRKLGARPVVSRLEIKDGSIISMRGGTKTILLKMPLQSGLTLWRNSQTAVMPNGKRHATVLNCGISETGERVVLERERATVSVLCVGRWGAGSLQTLTIYAEGLGPIEETTEFSDEAVKPVGKIRRRLIEVHEGAEECAALVRAASRSDGKK